MCYVLQHVLFSRFSLTYTLVHTLQVDMETHAGYMGGLKREFCSHTTLPYYATSSEEVLFHVSTRMPSKGLDVEQKVHN